MHDRLSDAACMRKVVKPRTEGDANHPEHPVERGTDGVPMDVRGGSNQREIVERPERDGPVANLIFEQPEVVIDVPHADGQREDERRGEERECRFAQAEMPREAESLSRKMG